MVSLNYRVRQVRAKFQLGLGLAVLLSIYAYYIEWKSEQLPNYKPLCDISDTISCSKAFKSTFGKAFGVLSIFKSLNFSNSIYALIFYVLMFILDELNPQVWASYRKCNYLEDYSILLTILVALIQLSVTFSATIASIYLITVIYYKVNCFCLLITSSFFINFYILITVYGKINLLKEISVKRQKLEDENLIIASNSVKKAN